MNLKQKTVNGLLWSFVDQIANQGVTFVVGIILARILSPQEFGLIGMIMIIIAVANSFINSGFASALIRKEHCTTADYSTVFYYNLAVGILLYILLFFAAPSLSSFFNEPRISLVIRIMGIIIIIQSLSLIQQTILTKCLDFKLQTYISVITSLGSGVIAIAMAFKGYGIWSLVVQQISRYLLNAIFLWLWNNWRPALIFSQQSFNELFAFGSKLLVSGLIDTIYKNIYLLVIGKFFSAQELGYYTRADQFKNIPSQNLNGIINRVSYPVLAGMQNNPERLRTNYQQLIRSTMFLTSVLMLGMAAVSDSLIVALIGEKWHASIIYLQMLCFVGLFYPLHALNLNMLQVAGRSDIFLKLEIIKKVLALPTVLIGISWGIKAMIVGMLINTLVAYFLNSHWSGKFINYSTSEQIRDIFPSLILAAMMGALVYFSGYWLPFGAVPKLVVQILIGAAFIFISCEIIQFKNYLFIKQLIWEKLNTLI